MATRTSLETKVPSPTPSSPRSPELPRLASLSITGVTNSEALQGPEKSSDDAMQALQRQQTQHAAAPVLSPSRVNTSVADDLDDILAQTLEETGLTPAAVSSSPVQPAATHAQTTRIFDELEHLLLDVMGMIFEPLAAACGQKGAEEEDKADLGQRLNRTIGMVNLTFKSLLEQSANPGPWLEQECQTHFYRSHCPFATSCFLTKHIDNATSLHPHLKPALLVEWKENYRRCVLLLEKHGLDRYNETVFPFSAQHKPMLFILQMMSEQMSKNPQLVEKAIAGNPTALISEIHTQNPQLLETLKTQIAGAGGVEFAEGFESLIQSQLQPLLSFYRELDLVLQKHPHNPEAVEAWLKAPTSTYPAPFLEGKAMLMQFSVESALVGNLPAIALELKKLVVGCRQHLFTLGLQRYLDEAPAPHQIAAFRSTAVSKKEEMEDALSCSLSVLKALSSQLKQLPPTSSGPEARDSNRQVIDGWLSKSQPSEDAPLASAQQLYVYRDALVGVLNAEMLSELIRLYPPCRDQLAALGLSNYLEEMPLLQAPQIAKPTAAAPQRIALSDKERFTRELAFFRDMIKQDDKDVNQWLKENSPKLDYPLLWAKKRKPLLSHFRDSVSIDLRREWGFCAETCLERVPTDSVHVDLKQIPADASPELKAFLA